MTLIHTITLICALELIWFLNPVGTVIDAKTTQPSSMDCAEDVAAPFSIPSGRVCSFWFLQVLTITCSYLSFFLAILGDVALECISLMTNDFEYILICVMFVHLLWRNVCSDPLPIFKLDYFCVIASLEFVYSRSKFLIRYVVGKYFLPFHNLSFHLTLLYLFV